MRTVRLVRGVVFLLFSYLVCLSWVFVFSLTWFASPPLGLFLGFFVLLLGLFLAWASSWASSWASPLGSCWGRAGVVLGSCWGRAWAWVLLLSWAFFCPLGFFPGGLWLLVCVVFLEGDVRQFFFCQWSAQFCCSFFFLLSSSLRYRITIIS